MKKIKLLVCSLLCLAFIGMTACSPEIVSNEIQEDILTVYMSKDARSSLKSSLEKFKDRHPNITLEFVYYDSREERKQISVDVAQGKGPDVIMLIDDGAFTDVSKAIKSDAFARIEEYVNGDAELSPADFYEPLLISCENNSGQLVALPIKFSVPMLITTKETLNAFNLPIKQGDSIDKIHSEIAAFGNRNADKEVGIIATMSDKLYYHKYTFADWLIPMDYNTKSVVMNKDSYLNACNAFKAMSMQNKHYDSLGVAECVEGFKTNQLLFDVMHCRIPTSILQSIALLNDTHTTVLLPISPKNSGYAACIEMAAAINPGSNNKEAAYELVKLLALNEYDKVGGPSNSGYGCSAVRKSAKQFVMGMKGCFDKGYLNEVEPTQPVTPPDPAVYDNLLSIYDNIDAESVYFPNESGENSEMIFKKFEPYIEGRIDFDSCFDSAVSVAKTYIAKP